MFTPLLLPTKTPIVLRSLTAADTAAFFKFCAGLSLETRQFFKPHALDYASVSTLCAAPFDPACWRLIAESDAGEIIGYVILMLTLTPPDWEPIRYADYGYVLDGDRDCILAPCIADAWQGSGLGSHMLAAVIAAAKAARRRYMLLLGGTQVRNARAVHFYAKHGFVPLGLFDHPVGVTNQDMLLVL